MHILKVKKGDKIGKMEGHNGFMTVDAPAPGIVIEMGGKVAYISWKELEAFKASKKETQFVAAT